MSSDQQQILDRLTRIEDKVDRVADEVAEIRGARKMGAAVAGVIGAIAGGIVSYIVGPPR